MKSLLNKSFSIIEFIGFYLKEIVISNVQVAIDVLTPKHRMSPAFVEISTDDLTSRQVLALANLISMTPGTLSLDHDDTKRILMVHAMYAKDPSEVSHKLSVEFKERICRVF